MGQGKSSQRAIYKRVENINITGNAVNAFKLRLATPD